MALRLSRKNENSVWHALAHGRELCDEMMYAHLGYVAAEIGEVGLVLGHEVVAGVLGFPDLVDDVVPIQTREPAERRRLMAFGEPVRVVYAHDADHFQFFTTLADGRADGAWLLELPAAVYATRNRMTRRHPGGGQWQLWLAGGASGELRLPLLNVSAAGCCVSLPGEGLGPARGQLRVGDVLEGILEAPGPRHLSVGLQVRHVQAEAAGCSFVGLARADHLLIAAVLGDCVERLPS